MKPRILIIENSIAMTGALESILRSSVLLSDLFDFIFLLPKKSHAIKSVKQRGFFVEELPMKELRKSFTSFIVYLPILLLNTIRLKRLIRRNKINFMVCNDFYNLLPVSNKVFFGGTNYVCYVRFLPSKFPRALVQLWFGLHHHFAKEIIAVSEAVKRELPVNKKTSVIYNELPSDQVPYSASNSTLILYPANYTSGKGQEYAIKAFAKICAQYPQWKLQFVGGDMGLEKNRVYKNKLLSLSKEYGIQSQVQLNSFKDNLKDDYLSAAMVLNFSESESFSLTCLEALFYGRAVVATRCGGPEEIIEHNKTGILVDVQDIEGMASAMNTLLKDQYLRQEMGESAYTAVREKFSNGRTRERLQSAYLEHIRHNNE